MLIELLKVRFYIRPIKDSLITFVYLSIIFIYKGNNQTGQYFGKKYPDVFIFPLGEVLVISPILYNMMLFYTRKFVIIFILTKKIEPTYSLKALLATSTSFAGLNVYFHPYFRHVEPEDGIYETVSTPFFSQSDYNNNKVCITTTKSNIYWTSIAGQMVHVSHEGAKLQVRFCNLQMGGNNAQSYKTSASGNLIEK